MNNRIMLFSILAIPLGIYMILFGGYDDSPGAQGLGLIALIVGITGIVKSKKKNSNKTGS